MHGRSTGPGTRTLAAALPAVIAAGTSVYSLAGVWKMPVDGQLQQIQSGVISTAGAASQTPQPTPSGTGSVLPAPFVTNASSAGPAEIPLQAPSKVGAPSIADLLQRAGEAKAVGVRMAAFVTRAEIFPSDELRVTAVIEVVDPTVRLVATGAALLDRDGKTVAADRPVAGRSAVLTRSQMVVRPGHYDLRVAVVDEALRAGSVHTPVDLALVRAGSLSLSTLALGLPAAPGPSPRTGRGRLAARPTIRLEFGAETQALAFFDLYGGSANERVSVDMDVLRRPEGPPIQEIQAQIQPAGAGEPDHYLVTAPIDLARLAPGDYLVRATVNVPGQRAGVITRTLRKIPPGLMSRPDHRQDFHR